MSYYLLPIGILVIVVLLMGFTLARRYGRDLAIKAMVGVVGLSVVAAFVTFRVLIKDVMNDDNLNPAEPWQKVPGLEERITELQYRSGLGLFAMTTDSEIQITGVIPFCLPDGDIAYQQVGQVEMTSSPHINLPSPPMPGKQQVSFNITYPVEYDAGAASSFVVYENGQVWCTERFYQAGQTAGVALGLAAYGALYFASIVFVCSLIVIFILAVIILKIYRRSQKPKGSPTGSAD